jgi:hypothetical protein
MPVRANNSWAAVNPAGPAPMMIARCRSIDL